MYFLEYCLRKTWLDKCLKSRVSEDCWTEKMANGSKNCRNLNGSIFTIFIDHCGGNYFGKGLF